MAFLSFNDRFKSNMQIAPEDEDENRERLKKVLPLRYTWAVWEQIMPSSDNAGQYSDATHKVSSFSTVQDLWRFLKYMPQPSELLDQKRIVREHPTGLHVIDALMIFRDGIRPEWEDPLNASGGHFQFQLKPSAGGGQIDEYWNNLLLGIVGATIEPAAMITGIRLVDKLTGPRAANVIRLEIWFTSYDDSKAVSALKRSVERCMGTRLDGSVQQVPKCDVKAHSAK